MKVPTLLDHFYDELPSKDRHRQHSVWLWQQYRTLFKGNSLILLLQGLAGCLFIPQVYFFAFLIQSIALHTLVSWNELYLWLGITVVRHVCLWWVEYLSLQRAEILKQTLRQALVGRLLRLPSHRLSAYSQGALSSLIIDHIESLENFYARYIPSLTMVAVLPVIYVIVICWVDWVVGLIFLFSVPMIPLFMALIGWRAEQINQRYIIAMARLSGFFVDRLRALDTLKRYRSLDAESKVLSQASQDLSQKTMKVLKLAFLSSAVLELFAALGVAGVAVYIGLTYLGYLSLSSSHFPSLLMGLFCLLMAPEIFMYFRQFAVAYHDKALAVSGLDEIYKVCPEFFSDPDSTQSAMTPKIQEADSSALALVLREVAVQWPAGGTLWDKPISIDVSAGKKMGMIGKSGVGKTTLLRLLARLESCQGEILLGDRPLSEWPEHELRQRVAYVPQQPYIFPGTIAENLRIAAATASDDTLCDVLSKVGLHEFANPEGLAVMVAEDQRGVSAGQAKRLGLARVLLRNPTLVLLDEPTANLDPVNAKRVLEVIDEFSQGRTLVMVTHDRSHLQFMDEVLELP